MNSYRTYCLPDGKSIEIEMPDKYTSNAIFLSGGADSAILMYLLAKLIVDTGRRSSLVAYTIPRTDGAINYAPSIVKWISDKLDIWIHEPILVGDPTLDHTVVVRRPVEELLEQSVHYRIYLAENKVPDQQLGLCEPPIRTVPNERSRVKFPFANLTKDNVISLYYTEGVVDLLKLTHTCTEQTVGRCNKCFNCLERAWAFEQLGEVDPGTS